MSPEWNETLVRMLLDASFRAVCFAGIVAFILLAARVRSSGVRSAAWTMVLLAMLTMPILSNLTPSIPLPIPAPMVRVETTHASPSSQPAANSGKDALSASDYGTGHSVPTAPAPAGKPLWPAGTGVLYCIGVIVLFARTLLGWRSMARIARGCQPVAWRSVIRGRLSLTAPVYESRIVAAPLTIGILSPRVILPAGWREWPVEKLTAVLAHESSHVRRRDTLIALISRLNCCLFWFNPFSWWLERKLASTAELASDDDAVRAIGETTLYAEVLLDMAEAVHRKGRRLAWEGVGVNGNGFLGRRIDRLLRGHPFCKTSRTRKVMVALGCVTAIFLVAGCRQKSSTANMREDAKIMAQKTQTKSPHIFWAKRVRILTDPVNAPFEFGEDTGVQGLDVLIGNEIAKNIGLEVKWVKTPTGYRQNCLKRVVDALLGETPGNDSLSDNEQMFDLLKKGKAEILISAIAIDPGKSADFEFSQPYYETGDIIAHRRDRSDITDLASLSGKMVGVTAGRPADAFMAAQKTAANVRIERFSTIDDALGALNRKEMDAVVGDEPLITYSTVKSFHNITAQPALINRYQYGVVVKKNKRDLLAKINATLDRLKSSGEVKRLENVWLGEVRNQAQSLRLQDLERPGPRNKSLSAEVLTKQ